MSTGLWILLGIIALAVIVIFAVFLVRRWDREDDERERKRKESSEKLKQHPFVVVIRERDRRKTNFESMFIGELVNRGATIKALKESEVKQLLEGDLSPIPENTVALIGTTWKEGSYWALDYRMIKPDGKIILADCDHELWGHTTIDGEPLLPYLVEKIAAALEPAA